MKVWRWNGRPRFPENDITVGNNVSNNFVQRFISDNNFQLILIRVWLDLFLNKCKNTGSPRSIKAWYSLL
jgi:hypothetical protein